MEKTNGELIKEFGQLLDNYPQFKEEKFDNRYQREQRKLYFKLFPKRRKFNKDVLMKTDEFKELRSKYEKIAGLLVSKHKERVKEHERRLKDLAEQIEVQEILHYNFAEKVNSSTYASQGMGCHRYAECHAESFADHYRNLDIPASVQCKVKSSGKDLSGRRFQNADYEVWVKTDKIGIEILKRKSSLSSEEFVRRCWKRGVNPRVYNPFLPYGYEEERGIDYQGNRKQGLNRNAV